MVENTYIQMRGFHNLYDENGKIWGFQFGMQTKYYKGLWLSQFRTGRCIVDGVVYPKECLIWNIQGMDYTAEEMYDRMDQYWQLHDVAYVKVPKEGGLEQAFHFDSVQDVIEFLGEVVCEGDVLLVKGSRGMHMEQVVDALLKQAPVSKA